MIGHSNLNSEMPLMSGEYPGDSVESSMMDRGSSRFHQFLMPKQDASYMQYVDMRKKEAIRMHK